MPDARVPEQAARGHILVVDDDRLSRLKLRMAVTAQGHRASEAADAATAQAMLQQMKIDIVLLDLVMLGMDGFALLDWMQEDPALRRVPVIVVSALDDDPASVRRALESGARDVLPKAFDIGILKARLDAALPGAA